jgi:hypothetical protein
MVYPGPCPGVNAVLVQWIAGRKELGTGADEQFGNPINIPINSLFE